MTKEKIFYLILKDLLRAEGGYTNDPDDTGGETYKGISKNNFPYWSGWSHIDEILQNCSSKQEFLEELSSSEALNDSVELFYRREYFEKMMIGELSSLKIASEIFDTAVNCGKSKAAEIIQNACNFLNNRGGIMLFEDLIVDRKIGPKTIEALEILSGYREKALLIALNGEQYLHYRTITKNRPVFEKFFAGWMRRIQIDYSN